MLCQEVDTKNKNKTTAANRPHGHRAQADAGPYSLIPHNDRGDIQFIRIMPSGQNIALKS